MRCALRGLVYAVGVTAWCALAPGALDRAAHAQAVLDGVRDQVAKDPAAALAALESRHSAEPASVDVRYLRARLLERLGRPAQALDVLPAEDVALPEGVRLDVRRRRARLLARTGACGDAMTRIAALAREQLTTSKEDAAAIECALLLGDVKDARRRLDALARRAEDVFALRVALADALDVQGARADAVRELRSLLLAAPEHALAPDAERRLRLWSAAPFSADERMERAERLTRARHPEAALGELGDRPPPTTKLGSRWWHLRGMALYALRTRYAEASRVLARAARLGGATAATDAFHAARALARAGDERKAVEAYREFAGRYPKNRHAAEARYLAAHVELALGLRRGSRAMRAFIDGPAGRAEPALAREGTFELGFHALTNRRASEALVSFERYLRSGGDALERARARYWLARALEITGDRRMALARYRDAIGVEPLHWYALLAAARVRALGEDPGQPFAARGAAPSGTSPSPGAALSAGERPGLSSEAAFYERLGLLADAIGALRTAEPSLRQRGTSDAEFTRAYHALGEYHRPYQRVTREHATQFATAPDPQNAWAWEASYPRAFAAPVARAARETNLHDELIYAVMRKESEFDPDVVSYADAVGLMQLLPKTAEKIARSLGDDYSRSRLFEPELSIRWGSHYLGRLNAEFDGQSVLAIAAYNAGEHKVTTWLARAARGATVELDVFVEGIPIEQTRNYVRRVVGNWARYRYLQDPARGWPLELPAALHR